jgi:5-formyltetrahydrofolate cyclo-ligase
VVPAPPDPEAPKGEWRAWAGALPPIPPDIARRVMAHLDDFLVGCDGPVLGYVALGDEISIADLDSPPVLVLPRLADDDRMSLHLDEGVLERHRYGIRQPPARALEIDPVELAVALVPGRLFDREGYRLGRGGGHYDRLLPNLAPGTPVIGVTVEDRLVERLPREPHDQPMTHLVTEHGPFSTR